MTGPTSTPRGERHGAAGSYWETLLVSSEKVVPDEEWEMPLPRASRASRRAAARNRTPRSGAGPASAGPPAV
ncbi:hypothetical protein ACFVQ9_26525 [Streptomyces goshikiensis]|uniref:hypothetical protein n=1 Tax=Streptomyces goshikiensis TaxID=1942 RepID=UPI0036AB9A16